MHVCTDLCRFVFVFVVFFRQDMRLSHADDSHDLGALYRILAWVQVRTPFFGQVSLPREAAPERTTGGLSLHHGRSCRCLWQVCLSLTYLDDQLTW